MGAPDADPTLPASQAEPDPDLAVLRRVAGGDAQAFGELVERHQERLLRLAERLLGEPEEARDAIQEVLLRAYRKAATFKPRGRVYTWLYRIAVNHCLNRLRRRRLVQLWRFDAPRPEGDGDPEPAFEPADPAPDAEAALVARRRWRSTREALSRLPASQRAVVVLARFEGLSYREIAEALGITLGAVESRLVRAMRSLAAALPAQERASPRVLPTRDRG